MIDVKEKEYWLFANAEEAGRYGKFCANVPLLISKLRSLQEEIIRDYRIEFRRNEPGSETRTGLLDQAGLFTIAIDQAKKGRV